MDLFSSFILKINLELWGSFLIGCSNGVQFDVQYTDTLYMDQIRVLSTPPSPHASSVTYGERLQNPFFQLSWNAWSLLSKPHGREVEPQSCVLPSRRDSASANRPLSPHVWALTGLLPWLLLINLTLMHNFRDQLIWRIHMSRVIQFLSFHVWLVSLSLISCRLSVLFHLRQLYLFEGQIIFQCIDTPFIY